MSVLTLDHYNRCAADFWLSTLDHDVTQNIRTLLNPIEGEPPFKVLDFGCERGRDLKAFSDLDHSVVGPDGLETWRHYLSAAGFGELTHDCRPSGLPREQQPWLASVWRRLPSIS